MYKCLVCGHIFDEGEQTVYCEYHPYGSTVVPEKFEGCPLCKGDYVLTTACDSCGSEQLASDLFDGLCFECLAEKVTFDTFYAYIRWLGINQMVYFIFEKLLDVPAPVRINDKLRSLADELFKRQRLDADIRKDKAFLSLCREYIITDDGTYGCSDFARWLSSRHTAKEAAQA